jgi:hypothetical protein
MISSFTSFHLDPTQQEISSTHFSTAQVEDQEVLAITFHPDKAVACFLPPDKPLVLSKGLTRKPIRRSGMNRRMRRRVDGDESASVPETAAGEYED